MDSPPAFWHHRVPSRSSSAERRFNYELCIRLHGCSQNDHRAPQASPFTEPRRRSLTRTERIEIVEADNPESLLQSYSLRYECLTLENGDERYANHGTRMYVDPWDEMQSRVFLALADGVAVGTVRYISRRESAFPADEIYDFEAISSAVGVSFSRIRSEVALLDRGAVRREFRRRAVFRMLQNQAEAESVRSGVSAHVGLVANGNVAMARALRANAWVKLDRCVKYNAWTGHCYVKAVSKGRSVPNVNGTGSE